MSIQTSIKNKFNLLIISTFILMLILSISLYFDLSSLNISQDLSTNFFLKIILGTSLSFIIYIFH